MAQIDNQKFGEFVTELRHEKNLTQKELADRLFVSDKAVSKWERGQSIPNVELLIPLADILGVTVTELLRGERIRSERPLDVREVEELVTTSMQLSAKEQWTEKSDKKKWGLIWFVSSLIAIAECVLFWYYNLFSFTVKIMTPTVVGLGIFFGAYFCFIVKKSLPTYYDENKINYMTDGIFRMHTPGIHFNNSNWPRIVAAERIAMICMSVGYPLLGALQGLLLKAFPAGEYTVSMVVAFAVIFGAVFMPVYVIGKKYE